MILCLFKCKHKSISQNSYSRVGTCVCILCWTEQWKCCTKLTQLLSLRFFTAKQSTSRPPSSYWQVRRGRRGDLSLSLCFHSIVFRASGRLIQERNRTEEGYQHVSCLLSVFKASSDSNKKPVFSSCGSPCWPRRRRNALTSHLLWAHRKRTCGRHWSRVLWGAPGAMQKWMPGTRSARPSLPRAWSVVPLDFPYKAQVQRKNY